MDATLDAVKRETRGKNEARRLRAGGRIPATIYGAQKEGDPGKSFPVAVDPKPLLRILHSGSGLNTLITLNLDGEGASRVLVKDFQLDPITHTLLHADFYRVNMDRKITVTVPLVFKGEPRGVKLEGGVTCGPPTQKSRASTRRTEGLGRKTTSTERSKATVKSIRQESQCWSARTSRRESADCCAPRQTGQSSSQRRSSRPARVARRQSSNTSRRGAPHASASA